MLPAAHRGLGESFGFPDVCNTPIGTGTAPIPYPNTGSNTQATGFSNVVKIQQQNAVHISTSVPQTSGDESGSAHATVKGKVTFVKGSQSVFIEKQPAVTLTSSTTQNNSNCGSAAVIVPSAPTVLFAFKGAPPEPEARTRCSDLQISKRGAVTIVKIGVFGRDLPARLHRLYATLDGTLVVDLRDNPGGELRIMREVAEDFLPRGALIATVRDDDGDQIELRARHEPSVHVPLVLLVNERTASAAEIFASALQAHGRALVVGRRTYGKASAHHAGSSRVVAMCQPAGRELHGIGVVPDVELTTP